MSVYVEKDEIVQNVSKKLVEKPNIRNSSLSYIDNRPIAITQRKFQKTSTESSSSVQLKSLDKLLENNYMPPLSKAPVQRVEKTDEEKKDVFKKSDVHYIPSGWENNSDILKTGSYLSNGAGSTRVKGTKFGKGQPNTVTKKDTAYTLTVVGHGNKNDKQNIHASWIGVLGRKNKTKSITNLATKAAAIVNREPGKLNQLNLYICHSASSGIMAKFKNLFTARVNNGKLTNDAFLIGRKIKVMVTPFGPTGSGKHLITLKLND